MNKIKGPIGTQMKCKGWHQEAAYRMIQNNLDCDVAEDPSNLIVYGGYGKAARDWESYDKILKALTHLENNETLLIQSGKPVAIFKTHEYSPRVIISNSMLVPDWANWDHFRELDKKGLMMYGQMTAGSWIYIGTQGILQGTYETLAETTSFESSVVPAVPAVALSCAVPEATPTLNVRSPDTYLTPAFTTSAST